MAFINIELRWWIDFFFSHKWETHLAALVREKKCITYVKERNKILNKYLDAKLVQTSEDGLSDLWPLQSPEVFRLVAIYWTGRQLKIPAPDLQFSGDLNKIRFKIIQHFVFLCLKFSYFCLSLCLFCAEWLKKEHGLRKC